MLDCSKKLIIFHIILHYYSSSQPQSERVVFDEAPPSEIRNVL